MELIFLGTGSAFTVGADNYNSNMLLHDSGNQRNLLIDCGSDARHSLHKQGYSFKDITDVYISHSHADHAGGLEWLGLSRRFNHFEKPNLYANTDLIQKLWDETLRGGMKTLIHKEAELDSFFVTHPIASNKSFTWNHIEFQTIKTQHFMSANEFMPSYGLFFKINSTKIFLTTDTQFTPESFQKYYEDADIIFHDCETTAIPSAVHSNFDQLTTLATAIKNKMWLYHYHPGELPDAKAAGFKGFVTPGQCFQF
jgi:ribonuclease BN (tRNA processing enzyme)